MPDQPVVDRSYGTGAVQSPPDERDYPIEELLAAAAPELVAAALPSRYVLAMLPPVLDQGNTPMCVAYSSSAMKSRQDRVDVGSFFNFDEALFFRLIGGTANGAVARNALDRMLRYGYPVFGAGDAARHRIAAYYRVPKNITTIKQAIAAFGGLTMTGPWYHNWIYGLPSSAVLPRPDYGGNGHQVYVIGWDDAKGLYFQNSWGSQWAAGGRAWMPYYYVVNTMWELWKATDVRTGAPTPTPTEVHPEVHPMLRAKAQPWEANAAGTPIYETPNGRLIRTIPAGTDLTTIGETDDGAWRQVLAEVSGVNRWVYARRSTMTPLPPPPRTRTASGDPAFDKAIQDHLIQRIA